MRTGINIRVSVCRSCRAPLPEERIGRRPLALRCSTVLACVCVCVRGPLNVGYWARKPCCSETFAFRADGVRASGGHAAFGGPPRPEAIGDRRQRGSPPLTFAEHWERSKVSRRHARKRRAGLPRYLR
ncbi:hypothetical protein HPB48_016093 [Haemaphysalis longicornis]|uniref:Uncharacterized protein n=1 Tax=Haemaphysalis longicornis TaxID=44386 RepID=A0A9J6GYN7_HAELO|nr:hypothetical protein HPB48_016093 [Haemaphysalis longicornis]